MDDLGEIIDELTRIAETAVDPLGRVQARLLKRLAESLADDRQLKRQLIQAIELNLRTQRTIRQAIGRPRKPKGLSHGKEAKRKPTPKVPPEADVREVGTDG